MEKKTLYYFIKSEKAARALAADILDGKNDVIIWTGTGRAICCTGTGAITAERDDMLQHRDAVEIWPDMDEKALKNAHRIASGRAGIREKEEKAAALLAKGDAMTAEDRLALLALVNVAYHSSGKIEGVTSVDSCAACEFCQKMIAAAAENLLYICGCCYAAADAYKEFSWRTHQLNARILSSQLFTAEELKTLDIDTAETRFNEDGDTVNETHARNMLRIAETRLHIMFGYWFKNSAAVEAGLHAEGIHCRADLPRNVRFIHSALLIGFPPAALWFDDALFVVYPDRETLAAAVAAGAHECNGRKCMACGYFCYVMKRRETPVIIAEYLRTSDKKRAAIMDAYRAHAAKIAARGA